MVSKERLESAEQQVNSMKEKWSFASYNVFNSEQDTSDMREMEQSECRISTQITDIAGLVSLMVWV